MRTVSKTTSTTQTGAAIFGSIDTLATNLFTRLGVAPVKQGVSQ